MEKLPTEIWYQILRYLMPCPFVVHIKWSSSKPSSSKPRRLSYMICPLNLPDNKIFIRDIYLFSKTCKKALLIKDQIFHELLHLHFEDIDVFKRFAECHQRFTIATNGQIPQSFRGIDLAFCDMNNDTISKLWSIKPLYGVSCLRIYLLQSPSQRLSDEKSLDTLRSLPSDEVYIQILERIERVSPRSPVLRKSSLAEVAKNLMQGVKERTSRGYAYGYPHENCAFDAKVLALEQLKKADDIIHNAKMLRLLERQQGDKLRTRSSHRKNRF